MSRKGNSTDVTDGTDERRRLREGTEARGQTAQTAPFSRREYAHEDELVYMSMYHVARRQYAVADSVRVRGSERYRAHSHRGDHRTGLIEELDQFAETVFTVFFGETHLLLELLELVLVPLLVLPHALL